MDTNYDMGDDCDKFPSSQMTFIKTVPGIDDADHVMETKKPLENNGNFYETLSV